MDTVRFDARLDADTSGDANAGGEALGGRRRRRHWSREDKARIVSEVARRHGLTRGLLTTWRRAFGLEADDAMPRQQSGGSGVPGFMPVQMMEEAGDGQGRIEVDLRLGRVSLSGNVDPALARSVLGALRGL